MCRLQARSSGGERYLDTVEVGGSKPPAPILFFYNYRKQPEKLRTTKAAH
jgi:hypothetical protein